MNKTFEVIYEGFAGIQRIKVYENGRRIADSILDDCDIDGACKILEVLGYQCLHRAHRSYRGGGVWL